jgi:hypothetical protein
LYYRGEVNFSHSKIVKLQENMRYAR